jgi:tRNA(fMet)-specific endonuclease VapC
LLDTTFLIDAERAGGGLDEVIDDEDDVAIAAITVAELTVGVQLSRGKAMADRQELLDDVLASIPLLMTSA